MKKDTKLGLIIIFFLIIAGIVSYEFNDQNHKFPSNETTYELLGNTSNGTVEKAIYGNVSANTTIAVVTGMHPRETLAIEPEIKAIKEFANDSVKIIHYRVNVTNHPKNYEIGRASGEKLVHDFINPDVTKSDAGAVIISHSHIKGYGEGFFLATPEMDKASVRIAKNISNSSDFKYFQTAKDRPYQSTSIVLVSKPIAKAGYPTFVYEIPENITKKNSTDKTIELFKMMAENIS